MDHFVILLSLLLPAGERAERHVSLGSQAAGWAVDVEWQISLRVIRQALEMDSPAGLHWAGQGDFFPVSV